MHDESPQVQQRSKSVTPAQKLKSIKLMRPKSLKLTTLDFKSVGDADAVSPITPRPLVKTAPMYRESYLEMAKRRASARLDKKGSGFVRALEGTEVEFNLIFTNTILQKDFILHCQREFNLEGLLFVLDVSKFTNCTDNLAQVQMCTQIVDKYMLRTSDYEINVDGVSKNKVLTTYNQSNQRTIQDKLVVPVTLFDNLYRVVYGDLREDVFSRYIISDAFRQLVREHGESFVYEIVNPSLDHNSTIFDLKHLMRIPFMNERLRKFSVQEHSEESIDSYNEIIKYKKSTKQKRNRTKKIFKQFVEKGAKNEVAIPPKMYDSFVKNMPHANLEIFSEIEDHLVRSSIYDIYVRFATSSSFEESKAEFVKMFY
jgi:hypothetical protein